MGVSWIENVQGRWDEEAVRRFGPFDEASIEWRKATRPVRGASIEPSLTEARAYFASWFANDGKPNIADPYADSHAADAEYRAALERWERDAEEWEEKSGYKAAQTAVTEAGDLESELLDELTTMEPRTAGGLRAKARVSRRCDWCTELGCSLADDICRLSGDLG